MIWMKTPKVSFVVPCYKLAHLLPICIRSILSQTYQDYEILIMDDASPDDTAEVAHSFKDQRVKYVRNGKNLGHLQNYNKGIALSVGKYVWLISADDYLRRPYALERYVVLMEAHRHVGYVCCPGIGVKNGQETQLLTYSVCGRSDRIFDGRNFLKTLLYRNAVVAASAMARRECYEKLSVFPLDDGMRWSGDWYLWCLFALSFDVGYFAEPMVCYREHDLSMTSVLTQQENVKTCLAGEIALPWLIRQKAVELGLRRVARECMLAAANQYAQHCASKTYSYLDVGGGSSLSVAGFEESLCQSAQSEAERDWVRARVLVRMGDIVFFRGDRGSARKFYLRGLQKDPFIISAYVKLLLLSLGKQGEYVRALPRSLRGLCTQSAQKGS